MIPREEWHLDTRRLGRRVLVYNALDSTNTQAAALANDLGNDGLVILADCQTAGRGQQGRKWFCTPGTGVLMSVLLFPPPALRRPALLTALAAVSVCETIGEVAGLESAIKWPNDVLSAGRKVCGILIEQGQGTVIGMGLNVRQTAVELAGLPQASSLLLLTGKWLSPSVVARRLIERLDEGYHRLCSGDLATLEKQWQDRLGLAGHMVVAEVHGGTCRGRLQEL
ncbi:MAG TPA: biotin--[acetyl-CoA-carboxylase] ligase, partial [Gemmataceae bacterium]|nr:biotin--[acetyl-CoA-carboxylase] ligase [Gemmataceae bacterium]